MSTNNGGHYQDIQKSVRAGSPNGYPITHPVISLVAHTGDDID
jgi:hypothetical protein